MILTGGMIALVFTFSRPLIAFLLKSENAEVLSMAQKTGVLATRILVCSMIVMTPMYLYRFTLQTMGYQRFIMVAAVMQTIARIGTVRLLPSLLGENAYFLSNLFAWMATFPLVAIPYYQKISSLCRGEHLNPDSFAEGSGDQGCIRNPE